MRTIVLVSIALAAMSLTSTYADAGAWCASYRRGVSNCSYSSIAQSLATNMDEGEPDALIGTDFAGLMAWIDNYCRAKPLEAVIVAANALLKRAKITGYTRDGGQRSLMRSAGP